MKRKLYEIPAPEERTVIIPEDVYLALEGHADAEAKRMAGKTKVADHPIARMMTPKSLAQSVLRDFAQRKCGKHYTPSRDPKVRAEGE